MKNHLDIYIICNYVYILSEKMKFFLLVLNIICWLHMDMDRVSFCFFFFLKEGEVIFLLVKNIILKTKNKTITIKSRGR
jgi:hypothetical protein